MQIFPNTGKVDLQFVVKAFLKSILVEVIFHGSLFIAKYFKLESHLKIQRLKELNILKIEAVVLGVI